eukprot:3822090-Ditylum_brightwellii.AAC.1
MILKPTRNVGVQAEVKAIEEAKLSNFGNDSLKMLDNMEMRCLLTTTNQDFQCYVKGKKDPFDEGQE